MIDLAHAQTRTPVPGPAWRQLSDAERVRLVNETLRSATTGDLLAVVDARPDGQVFGNLTKPLPASERGTLLLDFEASLTRAIDPGLVVWLEPLGDRNSLRNLRGIEVKK